MLKNIKKYIPKRKYRERAQLESRKKLGLLEKKSDYKLRAEDYHKKENQYKKLKEQARTKNPDEFYHRMLKAKIIDGEHVEFSDNKTIQDKVVSNTKFINLINFKKSQIEKEKEKLKIDLALNQNFYGGNFNKKHYFFYNNEKEIIQNSNNIESIGFIGKKRNKEKEMLYKQKVKNIKQLEEIRDGLQEQKELLQPGKRKKINGGYKYFIERKK